MEATDLRRWLTSGAGSSARLTLDKEAVPEKEDAKLDSSTVDEGEGASEPTALLHAGVRGSGPGGSDLVGGRSSLRGGPRG